MFLSLALAWAEVVGATAIVIGVNALDYSGYPDCRPEYLEAFERLAVARDESRRRGRAPAHRRAAVAPVEGRDYRRGSWRSASTTASRTAATIRGPTARPCGRCDSCLLRAKGFLEAGMTDPVLHS